VPTTGAVFSAGCVELHDGVADSTFAVSEPNAQVLVTLIDDDDGTCGGTVGETWASSTRILQPTATATATGTATGGTGTIISGSIPRNGGFGLVVFGGGTVQQLVTATGCPTATMAVWATIAGEFVVYVPGTTIGAVNAAFMAAFPGGNIPANTPFVGKCV
jgi:PPE-repeat protein